MPFLRSSLAIHLFFLIAVLGAGCAPAPYDDGHLFLRSQATGWPAASPVAQPEVRPTPLPEPSSEASPSPVRRATQAPNRGLTSLVDPILTAARVVQSNVVVKPAE